MVGGGFGAAETRKGLAEERGYGLGGGGGGWEGEVVGGGGWEVAEEGLLVGDGRKVGGEVGQLGQGFQELEQGEGVQLHRGQGLAAAFAYTIRIV